MTILISVVVVSFLLLNFFAYRLAHAMTHFAPREEVSKPRTWWQKVGAVASGSPLPRPKNTQTPSSLKLPFETREVAGRVGTLEAWFIPHEKPAGIVLCFHGYGACKSDLLLEAKAFHEMGYACFLVDFPGSGGSEGDVTTIGYHEAVDVAKCTEYVRNHWPGEKIILYGVSMGAVAVLRALDVEHVEADRAILECPFDRLTTAVGMRMRILGVPLYPLARLSIFWGGVQHGFDGSAHNPVDYARAVRCPVLLMQGDQDDRVLVPHAESIYANLAGKKEMHVFHGVGHESYLAKQAEQWKEWVKGFLND